MKSLLGGDNVTYIKKYQNRYHVYFYDNHCYLGDIELQETNEYVYYPENKLEYYSAYILQSIANKLFVLNLPNMLEELEYFETKE